MDTVGARLQIPQEAWPPGVNALIYFLITEHRFCFCALFLRLPYACEIVIMQS